MLEGITVLNQTILQSNTLFFGMGFIGILLIILCGTWFFLSLRDGDFPIKSMIATIVGIIFAIVGFTVNKEIGEKYTEYKVTISDSVNFNEFANKYNIIEQEGKIYTITEKKEN